MQGFCSRHSSMRHVTYSASAGSKGQPDRLEILMQMSMAIGEENRLQKQAAETLSEYMEQAEMAMKRGMRRVNKAFLQNKSNHLLYLALFCLGIFFMLMFLVRTYKLFR